MALEDAIQDLIKSNMALIETIKADSALRREAIDKIEAEAKRRADGTTGKKTPAPTEKVEQQISTSPEDRKPADEPPPEVEKAKQDVAAFMSAATDEAGRAARRADVEGLLGKLKAKRTSDLSAADAVRLSGAIEKLTAKYAAPANDDLL